MLTIIDQGIISRRPDIGAYMPVITPLPDGTFIASQHMARNSAPPTTISRSALPGRQGMGQPRQHPHPEHDLDNWSYRAPRYRPCPAAA